mgnify:FL=1
MSIIVMKFGGTSVADIDCIKNVAQKVVNQYKKNKKIVVVVSAMSGTTDSLVNLTNQISEKRNLEEYDVVVSSGEQVTAGLLAMAISDLSVKSRSLMGWQIPIITDDTHYKAIIENISNTNIFTLLNNEEIVVIPGFQGVTSENRISTLGRGGSDTSAVAIAASIKAERCDIYTDVDGVYTADPRMVPKAKKLKKISYEEMLEMASQGAKVLQTRSVALAMKNKLKINVLSSFEDKEGTFVVDEEEIMEKNIVSGIAFSLDEAKLTVVGLPDKPGQASKLFSSLGERAINVDMIVQSSSADRNATDLSFTVPKSELNESLKVMNSIQKEIGFETITTDSDVAKIAVIGIGMKSQSGVAQKMFDTLAEKSINLKVISTSEIKISVLIDAAYMELAARSLHTAFDLDVK